MHLVKRSRTWIQSSKNGSVSEALVGKGNISSVDDERVGVIVTTFDLRAERSAVQKTWVVTGIADQQVKMLSHRDVIKS